MKKKLDIMDYLLMAAIIAAICVALWFRTQTKLLEKSRTNRMCFPSHQAYPHALRLNNDYR